jgi:hypothetical protein
MRIVVIYFALKALSALSWVERSVYGSRTLTLCILQRRHALSFLVLLVPSRIWVFWKGRRRRRHIELGLEGSLLESHCSSSSSETCSGADKGETLSHELLNEESFDRPSSEILEADSFLEMSL